jgi:hypothetical protein
VKFTWFIFGFFLLGVLSGQATAAEPRCPESAHKFWMSFRQVVLDGEKKKLAAYTRFPFEIRGTLDSSDKRKVNREQFLASFQRLAATDPGLDPQRSTMANLIKSTQKLGANSCSPAGDEFTVGTWDFELTGKGWRFVRAYVED